MSLFEDVFATLPQGEVIDVFIGLHWTLVGVEVDGSQRYGLASSLGRDHHHSGEPDVPRAGALTDYTALELARLTHSESMSLASVGTAALNALIPRRPNTWVNVNAEEVIAEHGAGKMVALVGHFPFIRRLEDRVGELVVIERNPRPGDLPAAAAEEVIPQAGVVAITGTTWINKSLGDLLALCQPDTHVILLGPSTPLSPVLFDYGVDMLCGAVVEKIEPVKRTVLQGGNFRQVHKAGVKLVTIAKD